MIMKKVLLSLFTVLTLSPTLASCGSQQDVSVTLDGNPVNCDPPARIVDGRTLMPLRPVFEALGMNVEWDGDALSVHASDADDTIDMTVGESVFYKNGTEMPLDVPAAVYDDYTFIPVRAVAEALDCDVNWDRSAHTVKIVSQKGITVHFVDVGQADCALVTCGGESLLIDGGNADDSSLVVSYLKDANVEKLDYMIATHAHEDHIGGLSGPLNTMDVLRLFAPKTGSDHKTYKDFTAAAKKQKLDIEHPSPGDQILVGTSELTFLGPLDEDSAEEINDTSIVCRLDYKDVSFMFTGDMERDCEQQLVESGENLKSTVLKVGHHGSHSSTSYRFLNEVLPEYAVISVGKDNSYGHPTEEVLSRLRDEGAQVFRTDMQGHIVMHSDGSSITVSTQKNGTVTTNPTISDDPQITYIGNKNSKKLHMPDCDSLPSKKNTVYFTSLEEALSQGYTKCGSCMD